MVAVASRFACLRSWSDWVRVAFQVGVSVVAAFWLWFAISVGVSEGRSALPYVAAFCVPVALIAALTWLRPRAASVVLIGAGVFAAWYYPHPAARLMLALPAIMAGLAFLMLPRRGARG
ncbi:MAG: hypothetical protein JNM80_12645 [Phycisphaerae bacterium]|nr:hypothetical protein [Phycisphaerae bacterium]